MHHGRTESKDQHGNGIVIAVLSCRDGEGRPDIKAAVNIQLRSGGIDAGFDLTPPAARDLATRLIAAANAAAVTDPAPFVGELYREPEAA